MGWYVGVFVALNVPNISRYLFNAPNVAFCTSVVYLELKSIPTGCTPLGRNAVDRQPECWLSKIYIWEGEINSCSRWGFSSQETTDKCFVSLLTCLIFAVYPTMTVSSFKVIFMSISLINCILRNKSRVAYSLFWSSMGTYRAVCCLWLIKRIHGYI